MKSPDDAPSSTRLASAFPWTALALVVLIFAGVLRSHGRIWWCACGQPFLWSGNIWTAHNSQHLLDPYSLTHMLHGVLFYGLLAWLCPRLAQPWRLCIAIFLAGSWEVLENSEFVINRYREATVSQDYSGDAVANSLGDMLSCSIGYLLAYRLGFWGSVGLFLITEVVLLFWIRDSLLLTVGMLIHPLEAIKQWQMAP